MRTARKRCKRHESEDAVLTAQGLVRLLASIPHPVRRDELFRISGLPKNAKKQLANLCRELADAGRIVRAPSGGWTTVDRLASVSGRLSVLRSEYGSGAGFVTPDASSPRPSRGDMHADIFIRPACMGDAWHGDRVRVLLLPGRRGKSPEGRIVEVLERMQREVAVKVLHRMGDSLVCRAADSRLNAMFRVDASALAEPARNDLLLVVPGERVGPDLWAATVRADFGAEEDVAVQEELVKLNHQVPRDFSRRALEEASALPEAPTPRDREGRKNLTELPFVTIDGETARDFDDAIFVRTTRRGCRLHVAVADVTHYVRPGSALDTEARERANSWYFPVSVEPMLPPALSSGLCSLKPGLERPVMVVEMDCDGSGAPDAVRIYPAYIRSAARLTYEQAQHVLDGLAKNSPSSSDSKPGHSPKLKDYRECSAAVQASLRAAAELAAVLRARRAARGSLDFELPEPAYSFDAAGRIRAITRQERLFSHRIIEECMIAANEAVARFLEERGAPVLYRVHPLPEAERLTALFRSLRTVEWARPMPQRPSARDLHAFLHAARGTPQEFLVGRLCLRAMMQARYQAENAGHFGLASEAYCHFTSPIRRYADIVVHRALKYALGLFPGPLVAGGRLIALADHLGRRERAAMDAEREMARRLAVLLLADRAGERFDGVISSVNEFGFFVELADMPVEGMVRLMDLADDLYGYDPDRQRLLGRHTGRRFTLGQPLRVTLAEVHKGRLEIRLIPEEEADFPSASRRRRSSKKHSQDGRRE